MAAKQTISVITPCFDEEDNVRKCYETIKRIFEDELPEFEREHIFCDNASADNTVRVLKEIAAEDKSVRIIVNSRNFGILRNTYNGVINASGDAVVLFMPVDMQDPPELIPEFVKLWQQGYEIVFGIRATREEGLLLASARKVYYRLLSKFSYVDYPPDVGDFQLVDKKVLAAMKLFEDAQPFMRMLTFESGFRSVGVPYTWRRASGKSRNKFSHLIDQGFNGIVSFSTLPLRLAFFAGIFISVISFLYAALVVVLRLSGADVGPHGTATIVTAIFVFGGVQLTFLGLLGEYVTAIFTQVRRRPLVIERERVNFPSDADSV